MGSLMKRLSSAPHDLTSIGGAGLVRSTTQLWPVSPESLWVSRTNRSVTHPCSLSAHYGIGLWSPIQISWVSDSGRDHDPTRMTRGHLRPPAPRLSRQALSRAAAVKGLVVFQQGIDHRQHGPCHSYPCCGSPVLLAHPLVQALKAHIPIGGMGAQLHAHPAQPTRALLSEGPVVGLAPGAMYTGNQPRIRAQVLGIGETANLSNLAQDQEGRVEERIEGSGLNM